MKYVVRFEDSKKQSTINNIDLYSEINACLKHYSSDPF